MNAYQKIDEVLKVFYENPDGLIYDELYKKIPHLIEYADELMQILQKLKKDEYIFIQDVTASHDFFQINSYFLSFDGKLFIESGGYTQAIINENAENKRVEALEHSQRATSNRMTYLTIILAVGALIAAIYYLTELYWKYHWFH